MELSNLALPKTDSKKISFWAFLALLIILLADWLTPYVAVTPPCAILVIGLLALKLRPRTLFIWVLIYSTSSIIMIYLDRVNWTPMGHELRFFIRFLGVFAANAVAIGLCIYRTRLEDSYLKMLEIFQKISSALIVSDSSGNIVTVNTEAARLCGQEVKTMIGDSYFKYFSIGRTKGDSIKQYLHFVQTMDIETKNQDIQIVATENYYRGSLVSLRLKAPGEDQWILTTLQNVPGLPKIEM